MTSSTWKRPDMCSNYSSHTSSLIACLFACSPRLSGSTRVLLNFTAKNLQSFRPEPMDGAESLLTNLDVYSNIQNTHGVNVRVCQTTVSSLLEGVPLSFHWGIQLGFVFEHDHLIS